MSDPEDDFEKRLRRVLANAQGWRNNEKLIAVLKEFRGRRGIEPTTVIHDETNDRIELEFGDKSVLFTIATKMAEVADASLLDRNRLVHLFTSKPPIAPSRQRSTPPRIAERLICFVVDASTQDGIVGDLAEGYAKKLKMGLTERTANWWYRWHVLRACCDYIVGLVVAYGAKLIDFFSKIAGG